MGMQHGNRTGSPLQLSVILTEGAYGLPTALHHPGIEGALVAPGQCPECVRQGEGQQEIVAGHLPFELALQPLLALVLLAMGTQTMTTGVWHKQLLVTVAALHLHPWAVRGATLLHGGQCAPMAWEQ